MRIAIRVDSSSIIGSGHLMRCLSLSQYLRDYGHSIFFISRDLDGDLSKIVRGKGFFLHKIGRSEIKYSLSGYSEWLTVPEDVDADDTIRILSTIGKVDMVIVDHYAIGEIWENKLYRVVKKIFVIDDLANRKHNCDFLLDQTFGREYENKYNSLLPKECKQFLGTSYCLLKEEYRKLKHSAKTRDKINKVLVFFGGSDDTGETIKMLNAIKIGNFSSYSFVVIVGDNNFRKDEIKFLCEDLENVEFHCQVDNMEYYISICDIAISAPGANTWERCILGLPSVITITADNQVEIASALVREKAAILVGNYTSVTVDVYNKVISSLDKLNISSMSRNSFRMMKNDLFHYMLKEIGD